MTAVGDDGAGPGRKPLIVDCHCHAGKGDGLTGPWDTAAPLGRYLRRAARAGIDKTVLMAAFHSDYRRANREVASICARHPGRFLAFAFVHAARDAGRIGALVDEALRRHGFRGIKLHRLDAPITREVCEVARAYRLPVLYDVVGEVSVCELLAGEYPDVAFVIPHLSTFREDWKAQLAFIDHLARHPNIHTDTSGVRRFDLLVEALRRAGSGKVLFGSDGPWLHPGLELAKVRALGLPPADERLVLGGNLLRLVAGVRPPAGTAAALGAPSRPGRGRGPLGTTRPGRARPGVPAPRLKARVTPPGPAPSATPDPRRGRRRRRPWRSRSAPEPWSTGWPREGCG